VLVLENGLICEEGPTDAVLATPQREYTKRLLKAAPSISQALDAWDTRDVMTHAAPPSATYAPRSAE
jgi:ABC-type glutathione transport system ATPase component